MCNIVPPPFLHKLFSFEYNGGPQCSSICADCNNCCDIFTVCGPLLMLDSGTPPTNYSCGALIRRWKSQLIHRIDVLRSDIQVHNLFFHQVKPVSNIVGIYSSCMLCVERFTPVCTSLCHCKNLPTHESPTERSPRLFNTSFAYFTTF